MKIILKTLGFLAVAGALMLVLIFVVLWLFQL